MISFHAFPVHSIEQHQWWVCHVSGQCNGWQAFLITHVYLTLSCMCTAVFHTSLQIWSNCFAKQAFFSNMQKKIRKKSKCRDGKSLTDGSEGEKMWRHFDKQQTSVNSSTFHPRSPTIVRHNCCPQMWSLTIQHRVTKQMKKWHQHVQGTWVRSNMCSVLSNVTLWCHFLVSPSGVTLWRVSVTFLTLIALILF